MSDQTPVTISDLPKILGADAFIILVLIQTAKVEDLGPVGVKWLQDHTPDFRIYQIKAALRILTDQKYPLISRVDGDGGGWVINTQATAQMLSERK